MEFLHTEVYPVGSHPPWRRQLAVPAAGSTAGTPRPRLGRRCNFVAFHLCPNTCRKPSRAGRQQQHFASPMLRRNARQRKEYLYRKSLEGRELELYEKKRKIRQALEGA